jgi:cation diffusion facilitator family transporter
MIKDILCPDLEILETGTLEPEKAGKKYPEPLRPPETVLLARKNRYRALVRGAAQGVFVRILIASIELVFALVFGSASLFMDALSTSLDIVTSFALIISFKLAAKPPDTHHPFGHGRLEPLAGLQLGLFLALLGGGMFFYNSSELPRSDPNADLHSYLWIIPCISILLLEMCYRRLMRTATAEESPALAADAVHYRVDSLTSVFAAAALLLGGMFPSVSQQFDHLGAVLISIFMIIVGINAARNNMHQLLDRTPSKEYFDKVRQAAMRAAGVLGTEKVRMQLFGPDAHVDIDVEVDPELTVEAAHTISQRVRVEIQKELPQVQDVIVHVEPYYPNDHHEMDY